MVAAETNPAPAELTRRIARRDRHGRASAITPARD
jgi:hypothetical protein